MRSASRLTALARIDRKHAGGPYYDIEGLKRFRESEVRRWLRKQGRVARSAQAERPARESNPAISFRRAESGFAGQAERRDYLRDYQREWVGRRRAEFFAD